MAYKVNLSDDASAIETMETNNIDSYTLTGGPQAPFEFIELSIPKKRLLECAPDLVSDGIVGGQNRISVNYYGRCSNMVVTKCRMSGSILKITAYCQAEMLRGMVSTSVLSATAFDIIKEILTSSEYLPSPFTYVDPDSEETAGASFVYCYNSVVNDTLGVMTFPPGENLWFILQVCAMALGCQIFFAHDMAYLIDYRLPTYYESGDTSETNPIKEPPLYDTFALTLFPLDTSQVNGGEMYCRCIGPPELGDEGVETISNEVVVSTRVAGALPVTRDEYPSKTVTVSDAASVYKYGGGGKYSTNLDVKYLYFNQCALLGQAFVDYRKEPQQSISFTVNEVSVEPAQGKIMWKPLFSTLLRVMIIEDGYNDVRITNEDCIGNPSPQKLYLSSYKHNYPEGTTTYTFGKIANSDLSQSTSQIYTALNM